LYRSTKRKGTAVGTAEGSGEPQFGFGCWELVSRHWGQHFFHNDQRRAWDDGASSARFLCIRYPPLDYLRIPEVTHSKNTWPLASEYVNVILPATVKSCQNSSLGSRTCIRHNMNDPRPRDRVSRCGRDIKSTNLGLFIRVRDRWGGSRDTRSVWRWGFALAWGPRNESTVCCRLRFVRNTSHKLPGEWKLLSAYREGSVWSGAEHLAGAVGVVTHRHTYTMQESAVQTNGDRFVGRAG